MSQTGWFLVIFGLLFQAIGTLMIVYWAVNRQKAARSRSWPTCTGRVLSSRVLEKTESDEEGGPTTYYQAQVEYEYTVDGHPYRSNRIAFGTAWTASSAEQTETVERYRTGEDVQVHYRPGQPGDAVLDTTPGAGTKVLLIVGIIFDVVGTAVFLAVFVANFIIR